MSDFIIDIANYISNLENCSFEDAQNIVFDMSNEEVDNILKEMELKNEK